MNVGALPRFARRVGVASLLLAGACSYISPADFESRFDLDADGVRRPDDCDDDDAAIGQIIRYIDGDGDGYGTDEGQTACSPAVGLADRPGDCDDRDSRVHPDAAHICDVVDADCDGLTDPDPTDQTVWYRDADGDGFGAEGSGMVEQCDPPGADWTDVSGDCDDDNVVISDRVAWFQDLDGDGYGDIDVVSFACEPPDGFVEDSTDCDDARANVHPVGLERCDAEGVDENCNGDINDEESGKVAGQLPFYLDLDGDDWGDPAAREDRCWEDSTGAPPGLSTNNLDCDDTDTNFLNDACPLVSVSAGHTAVCARLANGQVSCYGDAAIRDVPDEIAYSGTRPYAFADLAIGKDHACGVTYEGELVCWGAASSLLDTLNHAEGPFYSVTIDLTHTCALVDGGSAKCWGEDINYSFEASDGSKFVTVEAGTTHTCALTDPDGDTHPGGVQCAGACTDEGECDDRPGPYTSVVAGYNFSCAIQDDGDEDGLAECWGTFGTMDSVAFGEFTSLSAYHTTLCGLRADGSVACLGPEGLNPSAVPPGAVFSAVTAGGGFACGITDEEVVCWNAIGALCLDGVGGCR